MSIKTRLCDMCLHFVCGELLELEPDDGITRWTRKPSCALGHKPRFYQPNSPMDEFWGWKRRCADYSEESL